MRGILSGFLAIIALASLGGAGTALADCHGVNHAHAPAAQSEIRLTVSIEEQSEAAAVAQPERVAGPDRAWLSRAGAPPVNPCHTASCCESGCSHLAVSLAEAGQDIAGARSTPATQRLVAETGLRPPREDRPPRS